MWWRYDTDPQNVPRPMNGGFISHGITMGLSLEQRSLATATPGKAIYAMADMSLTNPGTGYIQMKPLLLNL